MKGRGIQRGEGDPGDLLVTFDVEVPTKLDKERRAAVEAARRRVPRQSA